VELEVSSAGLLEGEPWSAKAKSNTKNKSPLKGKTGAIVAAMRFVFPKKSLTPPTSS